MKAPRQYLRRFARSTRDLLNTLAAITNSKAGFLSLADACADTTTAHGRLMLTALDLRGATTACVHKAQHDDYVGA